MARKALTFGRGLGRSEGEYATDPASQRDVRNFLVDGALLRLRQGLESTGWPAVAWGTDVVCLQPFRLNKDWLQVRYDRATRELRVYKINPSLLTVQPVGSWATLNANCAPLPPVITAAEHSGKVFFAHYETNASLRAQTVYYTPGALDSDAGTLTNLTADLDLSGVAEQLKFNGVAAWGAFLLGWGFGNATVPDEPAMLRVSYPGQPTVWPDGSFVILGGDRERIVGVAAANDESLPVIAKKGETYVLEGTSPATWTPRLLDPHHGIVAPRAIAGWNGRVWMWSAEGPRVTDGTAQPTMIDNGLGLRDNPPTDLAGLFTETRWAFMVCSDDEDTVYAMFPDATTPASSTAGVALSMRGRDGQAGWSYVTVPLGLLAAARGPIDKAPPAPVTAYASGTAVADAGPIGTGAYRRATVSWTNNSYAGDEAVEVFLEVGGAWSLVATLPITGPTQQYNIDTLGSLTTGNVALRMSRGTLVLAGYSGSDPDAWSGGTVAGARAAYSMGCATPVLSTPTWARTSSTTHHHALVWTLAAVDVGFELESAPAGGGPWIVVATLGASGNPRSLSLALSSIELNTRRYYRLRASRGGLYSSYAATVDLWAGPSNVAPTFRGAGVYQRSASAGKPRLQAFISDEPEALGLGIDIEEGSTPVVQGLASGRSGAWGYLWVTKTGGFGATSARARFSKSQYGVTDYGPYSAAQNITTVNTAMPTVWSGGPGPVLDFQYLSTYVSIDMNLAGPADSLLLSYRTVTPTNWFLVARTGGIVSTETFRGHTVAPNTGDWFTATARWVPKEQLDIYKISGQMLSDPVSSDIYLAPSKWAISGGSIAQPTPGVGTVVYSGITYGALGGNADWVDAWWRDNTTVFGSWTYAGRVLHPTTSMTLTGLPIGPQLRLRFVGWHAALANYSDLSAQYPSRDFTITLT